MSCVAQQSKLLAFDLVIFLPTNKKTMNKAFQAAVAAYKVAPTLTHKQEVMRMYRR